MLRVRAIRTANMPSASRSRAFDNHTPPTLSNRFIQQPSAHGKPAPQHRFNVVVVKNMPNSQSIVPFPPANVHTNLIRVQMHIFNTAN